MKRLIRIAVFAAFMLPISSVRGQEPLGSGFLYQGRLKHDGAPFSGPVGLRFDLFAAESGGTALGTQSIAGVQITDGLFVVELNGADEFGADAFRGDARWLEVTVEGATLTPRQKLAAAPYALHSLSTRGLSVDAEGKVGIGTTTPTSALTVAGTIETSQTGVKFPDGSVQVSAAPGGPGLWATDGEHVFNANTGNVGIGTNEPHATLDVAGSSRVDNLEILGGTSQSQFYVAWTGPFVADDWFSNGPFEPIIDVSVGNEFTIGLRPDGSLVAWGYPFLPVLVATPSGTFAAISAGNSHAVALDADGTAVCWPADDNGCRDMPQESFSSVSAGSGHSLAVRSDGTVTGWGLNTDGQCNSPPGEFTSVSAGASFSAGIRTDGTIAAWGSSAYGLLNAPSGTFLAVSAGPHSAVAIRTDGTLVRWGSSSWVPNGAFTAVAEGDAGGVAIREDGTLVQWYGDGAYPYGVPLGTFSKVATSRNGGPSGIAIRSQVVGTPALFLHQDAAYKPGSSSWTVMSDRRLKTRINRLEHALDKLLSLHGRTYHWRDPATQGNHYGPQMGLIADEVAQVFPAWIGRSPDGYQTLTVSGFEALTVESVRELRREKDEQIARQCEEIAGLHTRLDRLEALLGAKADKTEEGVAP